MRIEGPLAELDEWTSDGRILLASGFTPPVGRVPLCSLEGFTVVGSLDKVEVWGNLLWGYGESALGESLECVSIGVHLLGSYVSDDNKLVVSEWSLREVAVHAPGDKSARVWPVRTYLAPVDDPMYI